MTASRYAVTRRLVDDKYLVLALVKCLQRIAERTKIDTLGLIEIGRTQTAIKKELASCKF